MSHDPCTHDCQTGVDADPIEWQCSQCGLTSADIAAVHSVEYQHGWVACIDGCPGRMPHLSWAVAR